MPTPRRERVNSFTLLVTILTIYRCEDGKRVFHRLRLNWACASWLLVPWASSWNQGTPGLLLFPALPPGMKAWWKAVVVLARPWGKTLIHNLCARLLKKEWAVGASRESQSKRKTPSVLWFGVGGDGDWIWWLEQEFWLREGVRQKQEAEQGEYIPEKVNVLLLPFPAASLQNSISRAWPAVLYTVFY